MEKNVAEQLIRRIEELEDVLYAALPFVEDHEGNPVYKAGTVSATVARIRKALGK